MTAPPISVVGGPVAGPVWRRVQFWVLLGVLVVAAAALAAILTPAPGRNLDPGSAEHGGSKALATVLRHYGLRVDSTAALSRAESAGPDTAVVVVSPDDYSDAQLRRLADGPARIVLLAPSTAAAAAVVPTLEPDGPLDGVTAPGCDEASALAAGPVDLPEATVAYVGIGGDPAPRSCYGGALVISDHVALLGSSALLRNDALGREGVAALDVNVLSADRSVARVLWLRPGADAAGPGAPSLWQLFPAGAHRAFWWVLIVGGLAVLWKARRLGPAVEEPLPVVVRAAEAVEGHGRLYRRAGARDRAAAALRAGTTRRLAGRLGLGRRAELAAVVAAAAHAAHADPVDIGRLLGGVDPVDDAGLVALATALARLETAAGLPSGPKGSGGTE